MFIEKLKKVLETNIVPGRLFVLISRGLLVFWLFGLMVIDLASFPYYNDLRKAVVQLAQSKEVIFVPVFHDDKTITTEEYIPVGTRILNRYEHGADIHVPVLIKKSEINKFLKYNKKAIYKRSRGR